jgi:peptidoglycan/LPS O-acetylase OafA/YrhL
VNKRIEYLDWLRALAAALVLFGHSVNPIAPGGAIGVSVFFVLSGYLITSILLRDEMMRPANICKFVIKRFARIYPLYVVQIFTVDCVLALLDRGKLSAAVSALPGLLTFTQDAPGWFGYGFAVLWTLAIEFWFYVTFPFLLAAALLTRRVIPCIILGIAVSLASKIFGFGGITLHYYDHFLLGSLCAAAIKFRAVPAFAKWPGLFAAGIALILLIAATPYPGDRGFLWFCQSLGAAVGAALVIIAGHVQPPSVSIPSLAFLGRISYSVYLMHAVVLDVIVLTNPTLMATYLWAFVAATLALSTFTYYAIERPFERKAHRVIRYGVPSYQR